MKIVFVTMKYPPVLGGVETQLEALAIELSGAHDVHVAVAMGGPARQVENGVTVHRLKAGPFQALAPRAYRIVPKSLHSARVAVREYGERAAYTAQLRNVIAGADIVHIMRVDFLAYLTVEICEDLGVPCVLTPYFHPNETGVYSGGVLLHAAVLNRCDAVFALLDTDRRGLTQIGVDPARVRTLGVCPLGAGTGDAAGFRAKLGVGDAPVVLFIGRMVPYKGVPALLAAAELVWRVAPDAHFVFIGPKDRKTDDWLPARPDPRIHVLGAVSEQDKEDALAGCTVFSMPSTSEIFPAVYLEAWLHRKPVVGGLAYGLRELIEGNEAGLCAAQEPQRLADALLRILSDADTRERFAQNGYSLVQSKYTKAQLAKTLLAHFDAVRTQRASQPAPDAIQNKAERSAQV